MSAYSRRQFLQGSLVIGAAVALAACGGGTASSGSAAPSASSAFNTPEWQQLMADAKKEGKLTIGNGSAELNNNISPMLKKFTDLFGVEVVPTVADGPTQVNRILAERSRGVYDMDITMFGGTASSRLQQANALTPVDSLFILPDLKDRSKNWAVDHEIWLDATRKFQPAYLLRIDTNLTDVYYNTKKVSKEEIDGIQSYADFLKPQWKGRIATFLDPNFMGPTTPRTWMWVRLGQQWFEKFTEELDPIFMPQDFRTQADGLIKGAYDVVLMSNGPLVNDIRKAANDGLPVTVLDRTLKDGRVAVGQGDPNVMDHPAHPNAAKLFINWLNSQEGQTVLQTTTLDANPNPSLRNDVPQGKVTDAQWKLRQEFKPGDLLDITDPAYLQQIKDAMTWFKDMAARHHVYGQ